MALSDGHIREMHMQQASCSLLCHGEELSLALRAALWMEGQ